MSFVSVAFSLLLLTVLLARLTFGRRGREPAFLGFLLVASLVFYAWHVPAYVLILATSAGVDFLAGQRIAALRSGMPGRKPLLGLSLATNLGLLGFFKYYDFGREALQGLPGGVDAGWIPALDVVLPIGISFYTFQSMSYTIDVYRGRLQPISSFWKFLLFVSFFPQLVAGPIVRASEFLYQLERPRRPQLRVWLEGGRLVIRGLFLKMVLADNFAAVLDGLWPAVARPGAGAVTTLAAVFLFSCQIFCDFAGYSNVARGIAYWLGFRLPVNFSSPYIAGSFQEFWTRWHITLSRWLRDYLYIPLGGNRVSPRRTYAHLMIVMLLGGLWHGAAWTFVIWGALHGAALAIERLAGLEQIRGPGAATARRLWYLVVQSVVLVAWIFFRSADLDQALAILRNLFSGPFTIAATPQLWQALALTVPVVAMHLATYLRERSVIREPGVKTRAAWSGVMLYLIFTCYGSSNEFLYFQF